MLTSLHVEHQISYVHVETAEAEPYQYYRYILGNVAVHFLANDWCHFYVFVVNLHPPPVVG